MKTKLNLPTYRRIIGALFTGCALVMAMGLIAFGDYLEANGYYQTHSVPLDPAPLTLSIFMVFCFVTMAPTILYPCVFDRFPSWFKSLPPDMVRAFEAMLGAR